MQTSFLANIIARVLIQLAPALAPAIKPGGTLILGGILEDRVDMAREAFLAEGLTFDRQTTMDAWSTFVFRKPECDASTIGES